MRMYLDIICIAVGFSTAFWVSQVMVARGYGIKRVIVSIALATVIVAFLLSVLFHVAGWE